MTATGTALSYTTIAAPHRQELEIRRSRFITVLERVESDEQARALVARLRREFPDARHHCSAYLIGPAREIQRANDDGEPSGTAGAPMLEALMRRETAPGRADASDIVAVVVRYFGGVLLGAGGLVRAYSESVSSALDSASFLKRERRRLFTIAVPPAIAGKLENDLRTTGIAVLGSAYDVQLASITAAVAGGQEAVDSFHGRIAGLTAGQALLSQAGEEWVDCA
ncbi:YigZ family protein [Arthrobacter sp. JZ12]|uniref:IMPACT family protein n=1 Tax=Arthrobacter sp. JZ12 TaxID=2654190 RepID=UPI002B4A7F2A|nr:YigZ family protein [Arthrobacter sp. JZ12]WRH24880.1 YigZ family protein [Arthrobacter sp. JZ12]